ncbi:MAG: T9SS type A sorting domain-containing protein [Bacteroidota bacterium]
MKNRSLKTLFTICLLGQVFVSVLLAQGWERIYFAEPNGDMPYASSFAQNIFLQADGSFIFGANIQGAERLLFTDSNGLITDLRSVPNATGGMIRSSDGNFVYAFRSSGNAPPEEDVYLRKYDENGNIIWTHAPTGYLFGNEGVTDLIQTSTGDYVFVGGQASFSPQRLKAYITKVDEAGNTVWKRESVELPETNIFNNRVVETPDGGFFMVASSSWFTVNSPLLTSAHKIDQNGNLVWMGSLEDAVQTEEMILTSDGEIFVFGQNMNNELSLNHIDETGNTISSVVYPAEVGSGNIASGLIETNDGGFAFLLYVDFDMIRLVKTDDAGSVEWVQDYGGPFRDTPGSFIQLPDDGFLIAGSANGEGEDQSLYLIRTDELGNSLTDIIEGYVTYDINEDCNVEPDTEQGLEDWIVGAAGSTGTFYAAVSADGYYQIEAGADDYTVSLSLPNAYWNACVNDVAITHTDTSQVDFAVQSVEQCPLMEVEIQNYGLRLCETSTLHVLCRNAGTILAEDVYVEVTLDDSLSLLSATLPFTDLGNNTYSFTVGDIDFLEATSFAIEVQIGCDISLMGQSLCTEAHIFPDSTCLPIDETWTGASIELRADCVDSEVRFEIENVGTAPMADPLQYTIIEDHVIMLDGETFGPLNPDEIIEVPLAGNGSFFRLESEQEPGHPGLSMPSAFVEGCGTSEQGTISLGFVNQYPLDDADHYIDINCSEVLAAYDPNAKSALPLGYRAAHYIEPNTTINYKIQFQNVGTSFARNVVVLDRLPQVVDPASIRVGSSSHPYDFELLNDGVVRFTFTDINLPDSTTDERLSQGFVQFSIEQDPDLAPGTVIENEAAIFFDANPAIITNRTFHTIGQDFITVDVGEVSSPAIEVTAYPNPFQWSTTIEVETILQSNFTLELLDAQGRRLKTVEMNDNRYELHRSDLPSGIYFYRIYSTRGLINTGRIMAQ